MSEQESANHYEQAKDDPAVWAEMDDGFHVPVNARKKGGLSTTVTVRFAPEDAALLRQLAERLNLSYSDIVRKAVRDVLQPRFVIDLRPLQVHYDVTSYSEMVTRAPTPEVRSPRASETVTGGTTYTYEPIPA